MPESKGADFFISYNQRDQAWAEWIAWQVEASGYVTIIQAWDFRPGSNFVLSMHDGLAQAKRVIIVLSEYFVASKFASSEWASIFPADPSGTQSRLIPVRVSKCETTGLLKTIVYIDIVGKDESTARRDLIAGLSQSRAKPQKCPPFPAGPVPQFPPIPPVSDSAADRGKFELTFAGPVDTLDASTVGQLLDRVRLLVQDPSVRLLEVREGLIHMTFDGLLERIDQHSKLSRHLLLKSADFSPAEAEYLVQLGIAFTKYDRELRDIARGLLKKAGTSHDDGSVERALDSAWFSMEKSPDYSATTDSKFFSTVEAQITKSLAGRASQTRRTRNK